MITVSLGGGERAAAKALPPIHWTVAVAGIEVRGDCLAHPVDARRADVTS